MKTIFKIVVALVAVVAAVNAARATFNDYQFKDAVHEALLFEPRQSDEQIHDMVMKLASEYEIPMAVEDITIVRRNQEVTVTFPYTTNVVLIPGIFAQDWTFEPSASSRFFAGASR
ncbi:MAG TPA: hypothetical protein VEA16_09015 [Vicinamibacterales bacterium]|nr:hypothetical protein [Vicinamibacterales bacterium]